MLHLQIVHLSPSYLYFSFSRAHASAHTLRAQMTGIYITNAMDPCVRRHNNNNTVWIYFYLMPTTQSHVFHCNTVYSTAFAHKVLHMFHTIGLFVRIVDDFLLFPWIILRRNRFRFFLRKSLRKNSNCYSYNES